MSPNHLNQVERQDVLDLVHYDSHQALMALPPRQVSFSLNNLHQIQSLDVSAFDDLTYNLLRTLPPASHPLSVTIRPMYNSGDFDWRDCVWVSWDRYLVYMHKIANEVKSLGEAGDITQVVVELLRYPWAGLCQPPEILMRLDCDLLSIFQSCPIQVTFKSTYDADMWLASCPLEDSWTIVNSL